MGGQIYGDEDSDSSGVIQTDSSPDDYDSIDSYTPSYDEEESGNHSRENTEFMDDAEYGQSMSKVVGMSNYLMGSSIASGLNENQMRPQHPDDDGMDSEENLYDDEDDGSYDEEFTENSESESDDGGQIQKRQHASFSVVRNNAKYDDDDESSSIYETEPDEEDDDDIDDHYDD